MNNEKQIEMQMELAKRAEDRGDEREAFEAYKIAADLGEAEAQYQLAEYYCYGSDEVFGEEVNKDVMNEQAKMYYEMAAKKGHVEAQYVLFLFLCKDEQNLEIEAMKWLKMAAQNKHEDAQCVLGELYCDGYDTNGDVEKGINYLEQVALQGNIQAYVSLGDCYYQGRKMVKENSEKAVIYYKKAAELGDDKARYKLADCYEHGDGVEKNELEAFKLYKVIAENGNVDAIIRLGCCYENGIGVKEDKERAVEWYKKALEYDEISANMYLGDCYRQMRDIENNIDLAMKYYQEGVDYLETNQLVEFTTCLGSYYMRLGLCYLYDKSDDENAFKCFKVAAENGIISAYWRLGDCYKYGIGVSENAKQAFYWYKKAGKEEKLDLLVDAGAWPSFNFYVAGEVYEKVADCYYEGYGVEKNDRKAFNWYQKAAAIGYSMGHHKTGICYQLGVGVEIDIQKAIKCYQKSGCADSKYMLGRIYEKGEGVEKNIEQAYKYYKQAADDDSDYSANACYKIAESIYAMMDGNKVVRGTALAVLAVAFPASNLVTLPTAFLAHSLSKGKKKKDFLRTDAGKEMMKYYRKAAEKGHADAKQKLKDLVKYT